MPWSLPLRNQGAERGHRPMGAVYSETHQKSKVLRNFGEGSRAGGGWSRKPAWKMRYGVELRPVVKVEDAGPKASHRFGHLRCRF